MKVLVAGFDEAATERLSVALRAAGHHVVGVTGRESCRALVRAVGPDRVLAPAGDGEVLVAEWLADLDAVPPLVALAPGEPPETALAPPRVTTGRVTPMAPEPAPRPAPAARPAPAPPAVPSAPPRPPDPPPRALEPEPWLNDAPPAPQPGQPNIASKLAQVRFGDYHSVLETTAAASAWEVREQFVHLARLYSPAGWPSRLSPEDIDMLVEIGRGLRDAYGILGDPELRTRYERALTEASAPGLEPLRR